MMSAVGACAAACGARLRPGAAFCPHCGARQGPPPSPSLVAEKRIAIAAIALFALALVAGFALLAVELVRDERHPTSTPSVLVTP